MSLRFPRAGRMVLAALALAAGSAAWAQGYPTRPLRFIVPFATGGGTDSIARVAAAKLGDQLGRSVVVENRPGGGAVIGTDAVAKSAPDGYTLLLGTSSGLILNPLLMDKLPYDAERDFTPISFLGVSPAMLVVNTALPVKNLRELIALAKARPGQLNYASGGSGSTIHIAGEMLKAMAGISLVHVPYKGSGPAMTDLLANNVQLMFSSTLDVANMVQSGRVRVIGVGGATRTPAFPDVPTLAESGLPGFESASWFGLYAPAGTPSEIVAKLSTETRRAMADREVVQMLARQGTEARGSTPEELTRYMRDERARYEKVIREARITLE